MVAGMGEMVTSKELSAGIPAVVAGLTPTQSMLLSPLLEHVGEPVSYHLLVSIIGYPFDNPASASASSSMLLLRVHIHSLRSKGYDIRCVRRGDKHTYGAYQLMQP